jgi:hypothetical protein
MNMMIGFGSTEQDFEAAEKAAIIEYVEKEYRDQELGYFTDEFCKQVSDWLSKRAKSHRDDAEHNRTAPDYPIRYSRYWSHVVSDASYIVPILRFHHINRKHALSPDGWGMMATEMVFSICSVDLPRA